MPQIEVNVDKNKFETLKLETMGPRGRYFVTRSEGNLAVAGAGSEENLGVI